MFKYFYNRYKRTIFQPRSVWRLAKYSQDHKWHKFFEELLFGWHEYFEYIMTPRFSKDISQLLTYNYDIRQIFLENSIKDAKITEDDTFMVFVTNS